MAETDSILPNISEEMQDTKLTDPSTNQNKPIDHNETILEEFNPVPYVFVLKDQMRKEIFLPINANSMIAECPPYHVLLDHLMAVLWCYYSKKRLDLLGTAQLHWALKILEDMKNSHGQFSEDVLMATRHLTDAYMQVCNQVDEHELEKSRKERSKQKILSFHQSSKYDVTKDQSSKQKDSNATNVPTDKKEQDVQQPDNQNITLKTDDQKSLSDDDEYKMFAKGLMDRSSPVKRDNAHESAMNLTFHKNAKRKDLNVTDLASLHLTDMLEDDDSSVLAELLGESESMIVTPQQPASVPLSRVSSKVQHDMEQQVLAKKAKDLSTVISLLEEVKRIDSVLDEMKTSPNPEATAKLKALIEDNVTNGSKPEKKVNVEE